MGLRTQTFILGVAATLASPLGMALGLGEIKIKSGLNQPLNAEILLQQTRDLTDREILVGLASQADFDRVGVDKPALLSDLKFRVEAGESGFLVRVTSTRPILEPYLNFIVQAQWPSGKLLREYTLLVDLPVYSGDTGNAVSAARSGVQSPDTPKVQTSITETPKPSARPAIATARSASAAKPATRAPSDAAPAPKASGETYGPVIQNDTLWKIAKQVRPDAAQSIRETMLELHRLNPEAFVDGNIDKLRLGQVLRLPAKDDAVQTHSDVTGQDATGTPPRSKSTTETPKDDTNGPQLEASKTSTSADNKTAAVEGRIKLSTANAAEGSKSGRGTGTDSGNREALTNELSITKEELDSKNRGAADLKSRLQAMDEQIDTTEKLIQVNSEEMRKLEIAIGNNADGSTAPTEAPASADAAAKAPGTAAEVAELYNKPAEGAATQALTAQPTPPPAASTGAATPKPAPATAPKAATQPPPEPSSWLDVILNNLAYVGAGLAGLFGAGLYMAYRRRQQDQAQHDDFELDLGDKDDLGWSFDEPAPSFAAPPVITKPLQQPAVFSPAAAEAPLVAATAAVAAEKFDIGDVVSESDIHIALEDFDTAEKLLLSALEQDPTSTRVLLKLLEIYSRKNDAASFDPQYAKLRSFAEPDAIERGEQLRSYIEEAPPFNADQFGDDAFFAAVNDPQPFNATQPLENMTQATAMAGSTAFEPAFGSALELDLDIDLPLHSDLEFDAVLDEDFNADLDDSLAGNAEAEDLNDDDFSLDFGEFEEVDIADSSDRGSLAEALAKAGSETDMDFSDLDNFKIELADTAAVLPESALIENAYALDDTELETNLGIDQAHAEIANPSLATTGAVDDFSDLDLSQLDLDEDLSSYANLQDLDDLGSAPPPISPEPINQPSDAGLDFDTADLDLKTPDLVEDADEWLSDAPDDADYATQDFDLGGTPLNTTAMAAPARVDDEPQPATLTDEQVHVDQQPAAPNLDALPSIDVDDDVDFDQFAETASANLDFADFEDIDADLGALANAYVGNQAELDALALNEPEDATPSQLLMSEPITDFDELDDADEIPSSEAHPQFIADEVDALSAMDEDEIFSLAEPQVDLDEETFTLEEPQTDLSDAITPDDETWNTLLSTERLSGEDEFATGHLLDETDFLPNTEGDLLAEDTVFGHLTTPHGSEFGSLGNLDDAADLDDFVEFEELDSLDSLLDNGEEDELEVSTRQNAEDEDGRQAPGAPERFSSHYAIPDFDPESDDDSELEGLFAGDELATKLDLLRAFVEMGDEDSAKHTRDEILELGSAEQRQQAEALFARLI